MLKQPPSKPVLNSDSTPDTPELPTVKLSIEENILGKKALEEALETEGLEKEGSEKEGLGQKENEKNGSAALAENGSVETSLPKDNTSSDVPANRARRLRRLSYIAIALGLVGSGTAYAFTQVAPPALQAEVQEAILPQRRNAPPVTSPDDPEVQAFTSTRGLFLTNQIFYRKVEALAGAAAPIETAGPSKSSDSKASGKEGEKNQAKSSKKATEAGTSDKSKTDKSEPAEKVTASAPPAPATPQVAFTGTTIDSVLEMRVAVAKDVSAIGFATSSSGTLTDLDGNVLKSLSPETASTASISNGLLVDGEPVAGGVFWIYPESGGYVAIGDRWYRGRVLVALRERGLIAVNYVLLGDYLYSVVGSEMSPSWSIESLKAQAVAARSYALTHNIHPASEAYFDLDNTQRFQAYKGVGREADTTQAAVQATAGEFISHDGGIVESLYAASQEIVDDAHKGSGMSQLGAKDLAEQGYSYVEILAHYYPGTALGRIETDPE